MCENVQAGASFRFVAFSDVTVCNGGDQPVDERPVLRCRGSAIESFGKVFGVDQCIIVAEWSWHVGRRSHFVWVNSFAIYSK